MDSRGITAFFEKCKGEKQGSYWFEESHPQSEIFKIIADVYYKIINSKTQQENHVINVIGTFSQKNSQQQK